MARSRRAKPPGGSKQIKAAQEKAGAAQRRDFKTPNLPWWKLTGDAAAKVANGAISHWLAFDQRRQSDLALFARLYGNAEMMYSGQQLSANSAMGSRTFSTGIRDRIENSLAATFNGIQSCVDTLTNVNAQHKPVVQFAATDGDWTSHKIAKQRGRFIAGWFYEQEIYKKTAIQFRDSGVWGAGIVGVFNRCGRAVAERVYPGDLFVDPASCITSNAPREIARVHLMDRYQAWAMFEGDAEAQKKIEMADEVRPMVDSYISDTTDLIQLTEFWRLPSSPGAGDGCYLMATTTSDLEQKEWRHDNFPLAFIIATDRLFGFWPQGLAEQLENLQQQFNQLSYSINEAIELAGRFKLFAASSSNLVIDNIGNETGETLRGDGAPTSLLWECVQPEVYARLAELKADFYQQSGVAQMVASQEKPSVDESGIAIRERLSVFDERHALWTNSYQDAHTTLARLAIQTVGDILDDAEEERIAAKERGESVPDASTYTVYSVKGPKADPIDFNDLRFEPDEQYVIQTMPVAQLPDTIEGRIAAAEDMVQAGWYDQATARQVFGAPFDVARVETLFNAAYEFFEKTLDAICEDGTEPPDPDGNDQLALGLKLALQYYAYAKVRDVSQGRIDTLTKYITAIKAKILEATPPPPTGAPPMGVPGQPQTSGLLPSPNAQQAA